MTRKTATFAAVLLLLLGAAAGFLLIRRTVVINMDGKRIEVKSAALTAGMALKSAGIFVSSADKVSPAVDSWLGYSGVVEVITARPVTIWTYSRGVFDTYLTAERTPRGMLSAGGWKLSAGDRILLNGLEVKADQTLPDHSEYVLQVQPAYSYVLTANKEEKPIASSADSYGAALWEQDLRLRTADRLSQEFTAAVEEGQVVTLTRANTVRIQVGGLQITTSSAASTVGQALADAGIPLQGLDFSRPGEAEGVPASGLIEVVRVREQVELNQTAIPYSNDLIADPELELDQRRIIQAGQEGIRVSRVLVRTENGVEVSRTTEAEWTAAEPQTQITGYGTKIVIRTLDTPDGAIQYWRSARVYATSYAPCNFLLTIGRCSYTTANGSTLQKGVIGTGEAWYRLMVNQGVYVEGYGPGIIGDWGYVGGYWVDLGYSDADFINWHRYTTLYWLTPVPANIPWILPP